MTTDDNTAPAEPEPTQSVSPATRTVLAVAAALGGGMPRRYLADPPSRTYPEHFATDARAAAKARQEARARKRVAVAEKARAVERATRSAEA